MILVKKIAFGNHAEAFVEDHLKDGVNLIFSNENNRGKTLLIQALLYSIGNEPVFPTGFDYQEYYFYSQIEINGNDYEFLRKNKTTIIKDESGFRMTESLSELKYLINRSLFKLPVIEKDGIEKVVDLYLFYQLFFVGQDKRNTSNITNPGQYSKKDFLSMLSSLNGTKLVFLSDDSIEEIKMQIVKVKSDILLINKKMKFLVDNPDIANFSLVAADRDRYSQYLSKLNEHHQRISSYNNQRSRETNRRIKLDNLLSELNSLNQKIEVGEVKCADCGSTRIIYTNGDISFEVSNIDVRNNIIKSIKEQIIVKGDTIEELSFNIKTEVDKQAQLMKQISPKMRDIIAYSDDILSNVEFSSTRVELESKLHQLEDALRQKNGNDETLRKENKAMFDKIIELINSYFHLIDPDSNQVVEKLFTKNDENFSGSESQVFYFSRIMAFNEYFKHQFPIIIDSYRSGELSTNKELKMLDLYKSLNKQVILTSTLKSAEYNRPDYSNYSDINIIDYSNHINSKILSYDYLDNFLNILNDFKVFDMKIN